MTFLTKPGHEFSVSTPAHAQSGAVTTALADGTAVVAWMEAIAGGSPAIMAQRLGEDGGKLGASFAIGPAGGASLQDLDALAGGGFVATWLQAGGSGPERATQAFSADGGALGAVNVIPGQGAAVVGTLANGSVLQVWADESGSGPLQHPVRAQISDPTGAGPSLDIDVSASLPGAARQIAAVALGGGGFVVSWEVPPANAGAPLSIQARVFTAGGTPQGAAFTILETAASAGAYPQRPEQLALHAGADGGFSATWVPQGGGGSAVLKAQNFAADGQPRGGEIVLASTADALAAPHVVDLPGGGHAMVFSEATGMAGGNGAGLYALKVVALDAGWQAVAAPVEVARQAGGFGGVSLAQLGGEQLVVTWNAQDPAAPAGHGADIAARVLQISAVAPPPLEPVLSVAGPSVVWEAPGGNWATFEITLSHDAAAPVTVAYATRDSDAVAGQDYTAAAGTVTFAAGETRKTVWVPVLDDINREEPEAFAIDIRVTGDAVPVAVQTAVVVIVDNEAQPVRVSVSDASALEGTGGGGALRFAVHLDQMLSTPLTLFYSTVDGTASAASGDFAGASRQELVFAAGEVDKVITIALGADAVAEADESFTLQLSTTDTRVVLSRGVATGLILNDDASIVPGPGPGPVPVPPSPANPVAIGGGGADIWALARATDFHGGGGVDIIVAADAQGHMLGYRQAGLTIDDARTGSGHFTAADGSLSWFHGVERIDFADGRLEIGAEGLGASVSRLYGSVLGRQSDPSGMAFWVDRIEKGVATLASAANGFASSAEFGERFGALGNGQFIEKLYEQVLGRGSDGEGFAFWSQLLESGAMSRGDVVLGFSESVEMKALSAGQHVFVAEQDALVVARIYKSVLLREAESDGMAFWVAKAGAMAPDQMVEAFVGSTEFQQRISGLSNQDFIQSFYQAALDRDAEPAGLRFWLDVLDHGASRGEVAKGFIFSDEMVHNQAASLGGGLHMAGDIW